MLCSGNEARAAGMEGADKQDSCSGGVITPHQSHSSPTYFIEGIPEWGSWVALLWDGAIVCDTSWKVLEVPIEMANVGTTSLAVFLKTHSLLSTTDPWNGPASLQQNPCCRCFGPCFPTPRQRTGPWAMLRDGKCREAPMNSVNSVLSWWSSSCPQYARESGRNFLRTKSLGLYFCVSIEVVLNSAEWNHLGSI